jgi:hypothetical protein
MKRIGAGLIVGIMAALLVAIWGGPHWAIAGFGYCTGTAVMFGGSDGQ